MCGCPEEGIGSPGSGVTDGCELRCGCWESNLDLLEKQKHSSSPQLLYFLKVYLEAKVTELVNIQSWILRHQLVSITSQVSIPIEGLSKFTELGLQQVFSLISGLFTAQ